MMKFIYFFSMTIFCLSLSLTSCQNAADEQVRNEAREALPQTTPAPATPAAPVTAPATTTTSGSVAHYECPNKCEGGVGANAGNCPVCGTAMAHNQAFHNQPAATTPATPNTAQPAAAAQNAAGEYHYICSKGCAGGAAAAGNCATCGSPLAHNQAFHNN
ncbi:MAG: hypothetical protein D6714_01920 [Bacteroidetes bacterium]|nr:MAG: hypothetical protein D6714_01920 [Bacteroidota bacterium]